MFINRTIGYFNCINVKNLNLPFTTIIAYLNDTQYRINHCTNKLNIFSFTINPVY